MASIIMPRLAIIQAATGLSIPPDSRNQALAVGSQRKAAESGDLLLVNVRFIVANVHKEVDSPDDARLPLRTLQPFNTTAPILSGNIRRFHRKVLVRPSSLRP